MLKYIKFKYIILTLMACLFLSDQSLFAQIGKIKWLRVGSLRDYYSEQGAEIESGRTGRLTICDGMAWPADYGTKQATKACRALFIGCKDFNDPVMNKLYDYKAIGRGPREDPTWNTQFFPIEMKMIGRFAHPAVYVDEQSASDNNLYDNVDEIDPDLPADRMIIIKFHTSLGITVTKKISAFSQQYNDNYYIIDYVFKNTGIVDNKGTTFPQTLKDCYFATVYRYAFSGEGCTGFDLGWAEWDETWGENNMHHVIGTNPNASDFKYRALMAWYGRSETRPNTTGRDWDWGLPNDKAVLSDLIPDECMAAAKYIGAVTLFASKDAKNYSVDNPYQPVSSPWKWEEITLNGSDHPQLFYPSATSSQYDVVKMDAMYKYISSGHPTQTMAEFVGEKYPVYEALGDHGGYSQCQGFGPYTLEVGDSVRIVFAEAIAGLNRQKNREVTKNWLLYERGEGKPTLVRPDGGTTEDQNLYKKEWFQTCEDSLLQTFGRAVDAYNNGNTMPQPPPPPKSFIVQSGGNQILLSWDGNAASDPYFGGYEVWRTVGVVDDWTATYEKIWECDDNTTSFSDTTAERGTDNYYYVVSKDDGTQNTVNPGVPLVSSKFYTLTNVAARLKRPAADSLELIRVVPNPFIIDRQVLSEKRLRDQVSFYELPPYCKISIFTERGELVWEKLHTDGSGDDYWFSLTSSGQLVTSGIYIVFFEVTKDYRNRSGEITKKGTHTYRKLMIIR